MVDSPHPPVSSSPPLRVLLADDHLTVVCSVTFDIQKTLQKCYAVIAVKKRQRIILFGDTLVLAGIAASMDHDPDCKVVACAMTASQQELAALQPDVVIFDLDAVQPDFQYSLAEVLPGLLLIGVDPKTNRALLWSGQQVEDLSSQDLARVIHQSHFIIPISGGKNENRNSE